MKSARRSAPRVGFGATIGALVLALLAGTAAGPATAAAVGPNLDPTATGSITLHKLVQPENATGLPNDGSELTPGQLAGLTPLAGVGFSLERVSSIDLTTNAGWDAVDGLTAAAVLADPATYPLAAAGSGTTDAAGALPFPNLALGLYLVTETDPGANPIAQPAAPFLVTVPLSTGENTWLYDVNVYPKNAVTAVSKTVDDTAAFGLGDDVTWTITGQVPYLAAGQPLGTFRIVDVLDARLASSSATVTLASPTGTAVTLEATDYVLTAPTAGTTGTVQVQFTTAGLAKLQANQGATVSLTLATEVLSIGDGSIENEAIISINDSSNPADAVTAWGALAIFKYADVAGVDEALQGAQFQVFTSEADARALTDPVTVDAVTTFTSDANGNILVPGLRVGDYWIVETLAPTGYQANGTPIPVTVVQGPTTAPTLVDVENTQVPAWTLPLTGSNGVILFTVAGLALLVLAAGTALVTASRRKRALVA